ncbi:EF-hand calcium-binding domain-containing protein 4A [Nymphon striatum]|nr:EF-hand calcium-binding domain-containing protein 4A [Nymphon striatum]
MMKEGIEQFEISCSIAVSLMEIIEDSLENNVSPEEVHTLMIAKAEELFSLCDKEVKGFITKRDMQRLRQDFPLTPEQLEDVFDKLDEDHNGYLTLKEFTEGFGNSLEKVLNTHLSEATWTQCSLPVAQGGLGVRSAVDLALLSSAHACNILLEALLPQIVFSDLYQEISVAESKCDVMDAARDVMGAVRDVIPVACSFLGLNVPKSPSPLPERLTDEQKNSEIKTNQDMDEEEVDDELFQSLLDHIGGHDVFGE